MDHRRYGLPLLLCLLLPSASLAFRAPEGLDGLDEPEREVLEAVAARPAEMREAALLASEHPDALVRIELIQARSSAAFDLRVQQLDREHQEELWELVRTPGVLRELVEGGAKDAAELEAIAARHPEAARDAIRHLGDEHFALLQEADAIKASADVEFAEEIEPLPDATRAAFERLLGDPELLAMLARTPSTAVAIGEAFAADPDGTRARLDALAVEVAQANAAVEQEWREGLEGDPEAQAELEQAAREYSEEYGYDYDELTTERVEITVRHTWTPYPYWFGYPSWYAYWYPWGWWYPVYPHVGYYYRGHHRVYWGLPSLHFVHWYYGGHHYRYRHVARHFHHGGHRHHRPSHAVYRTVRRHDRAAAWGGHRRGSPDAIASGFAGRGGRAARGTVDGRRGTRASEFRRRTTRMPDASFGRRIERDRTAPERRGTRAVEGSRRSGSAVRDAAVASRRQGGSRRGEGGRAGGGLRDPAAEGRRDRAAEAPSRPRSGAQAERRSREPRTDRVRRTERVGRGDGTDGTDRAGRTTRRERVVRPEVARPEVVQPRVDRARVVRPGRADRSQPNARSGRSVGADRGRRDRSLEDRGGRGRSASGRAPGIRGLSEGRRSSGASSGRVEKGVRGFRARGMSGGGSRGGRAVGSSRGGQRGGRAMGGGRRGGGGRGGGGRR